MKQPKNNLLVTKLLARTFHDFVRFLHLFGNSGHIDLSIIHFLSTKKEISTANQVLAGAICGEG